MELDALHDRLFALIARAQALPACELRGVFPELVATIEADFRYEEDLMDTFQCADAHLHREQHARMQAGLHHAAAAMEHGDHRPAQLALAALRDWLPVHIATQDRHLLHSPRTK
jgi:hemerythrin-like metal-binding protein